MTGLLIQNGEIGGVTRALRIRDGRIHAIAPDLAPVADETCLDARGGAVLPGLHDHHIHLFALAAARDSVACGPPAVHAESELRATLEAAAEAARRSGAGKGWLRGIGYHESVAGPLDRRRLDALVPDIPLRIQHRSGALWLLNSAALDALAAPGSGPLPPGVETDAGGQPTGRLHRVDAWLRKRLGAAGPPALAAVGRELARLGVTGVCDATPANSTEELALLDAAARSGELPQRLRVMGDMALPQASHPAIRAGELKIMLDENHLPPPSTLVETIREAHNRGRGVAFHCVTRAELVVAAAALEDAGSGRRDRIEHASLAPPDAVEMLARLGVTVVTQPNFLLERGDAYRDDVPARDQSWLYRGRGFLDAGVPLAAGTDAPFGACDPWAAMRAAAERRSATGAPMQTDEALTPEEALALFTSPLESPGTPRGPLEPGQAADLVVLDRPWHAARARLDPGDVSATLIAGHPVFRRD